MRPFVANVEVFWKRGALINAYEGLAVCGGGSSNSEVNSSLIGELSTRGVCVVHSHGMLRTRGFALHVRHYATRLFGIRGVG